MANIIQGQLDEYWQAVNAKICVKCIDGDGRGNCRLSGMNECGLKMHFPRVVATILSVKSDRLEPYVEALRANVCAYCIQQSPDGKCMVRTNLDCGLDRYFPLIVEVIEEVEASSVTTQLKLTAFKRPTDRI